MDEAVEEGIAIGMGSEQPVGNAAFRLTSDGLGDAAVEALHQTIGLRLIGFCQPVLDPGYGADAIEGMVSRGFVMRIAGHVDGEAIGEFGPFVGEDGLYTVREMDEEALQESGRGFAVAAGMDFHIDIAGRPVGSDEGVALTPLQSRQVL